MKKFDILVMGELNVDLILNGIQCFPKIGTEILAKNLDLTLGGSAAIFACNSSALGLNVAFLGQLGNDDFGNFIDKALKSKKVNTDYIIRRDDCKTGATFLMSFGDDRAAITYPGTMELLSGADLMIEMLDSARHLHVSSVFLQPLLKADIIQIFQTAKDRGLSTSLDTQWDPHEKWDLDMPALLPLVDAFLPNESEILALSNRDSAEAAVDALKDWANVIAVKLGARGSLGWSQGRFHQAAPYLNSCPVDAIGAGDSFDAGFVAKFIAGESLARCLQFANLTGAISTTAAGGTEAFLSPERIKETAKNKFMVDIWAC